MNNNYLENSHYSIRLTKKAFIILGVFYLLNQTALAKTKENQKCFAQSPKNKVAVVELYTSEGCSSCPPADNWLVKSVKNSKNDNNSQVVYLSNHVDYWDYIGWKDRFALPKNSNRQREIARANQSAVYTPQFFINGKSPKFFRNYSSSIEKFIKKINQSPSKLNLSIEKNDDSVKFSWQNAPVAQQLEANIIWTTGFAMSNVDAGENQARKLQHAQISRVWEDEIILNKKFGSFTRAIPNIKEDDRFGNIVFFIRDNQHEILQAVTLARNCQ